MWLLLACADPTPPAPPAAAVDTPADLGPRDLSCPHDPPLQGTMMGPGGAAPVAVIAVGGQMWDRWGDLPDAPWGHYRQIAEAIAAAGTTTFNFDKGGTGATGGEAQDVPGRAVELEDAVRCVRANGATGSLILIGHSQGSAVVARAIPTTHPRLAITLNPQVPPSPLVAHQVIQSESEANPEWDPIVIPGADHLLFPDPATPGESEVDPRALRAIVQAIKANVP